MLKQRAAAVEDRGTARVRARAADMREAMAALGWVEQRRIGDGEVEVFSKLLNAGNQWSLESKTCA